MNQEIIREASSQLGVKEISGGEHNMTIVQYAKDIGLTWINDDETPWCAIFVCWVLMRCKFPYLKTARARDYEDYGIPVDSSEAEPGDIVLFYRDGIESGKGHVGWLLGFNYQRTLVFVLGGNQSNSVSIAGYGLDKIVGFRRVSESIEGTQLPAEVELKVGSKGVNVKRLQTILKGLNYAVGSPDGSFGEKTRGALIEFQKNQGIPQTGVYDSDTRKKLFSLLNS